MTPLKLRIVVPARTDRRIASLLGAIEHEARLIGADVAAALRATTLELYSRAAAIARERGIILADTKFEFGAGADGGLVLGDEVLTPDSSRFWPADARFTLR